MKKIFLPIIALVIAFSSCQKVIDIDLNTATPQYNSIIYQKTDLNPSNNSIK